MCDEVGFVPRLLLLHRVNTGGMTPDKIGIPVVTDAVAEQELAATVGAPLDRASVVVEVSRLVLPAAVALVTCRFFGDHPGITPEYNTVPDDVAELRIITTFCSCHIFIALFTFTHGVL